MGEREPAARCRIPIHVAPVSLRSKAESSAAPLEDRSQRVREQAVRMTLVAQAIGGLEAKDAVETATHDEEKPIVLIVDDDPDVRESLQCLLRTISLDSRVFASPPKFIKRELPSRPTCLVLDVRLPGPSGLDFQPMTLG